MLIRSHLAVTAAMLAAVLGVPAPVSRAHSEPQHADGASVRSLAVVMNPYLEEGVTIRHLGRISSVRGLDRAELDVAMRTAPRELMNFTAARGPRDDDLLFAYAVTLEGAVVGYEGLVFDPTRAFNLEDAWNDVLLRPEALTLHRSPDKPRLDPADKTRILVNWGHDWPAHEGWRGWRCAGCAAPVRQGASAAHAGGPKGSGQTWEYWGRIVTVLQRSAHAYYHFVAECLPKLLLVQTELAEHPDAVVLVDESFGGGAWTREFLSLLGVPSSQLVVRTPGKVYLADTVHMVRLGFRV